jgi:hypothetical protein
VNRVKKIAKRSFLGLISVWFFVLVLFFINPSRSQQFIYDCTGIELRIFNTKIVLNKEEKCFADISYGWKMQDGLGDYWQPSFENGIGKPVSYRKQIVRLLNDSTLIPIKANQYYVIDTLFHSYAVTRPQVKTFLNKLGAQLQYRLRHTPLNKVQFTVTSAFRTQSSVKRLMQKNKNAIKNSSHLHGTTIDISYKTFFLDGKQLDESEAKYVKETLSEILFDLRKKKKCWVKFEYFQTCYHTVVA